MRDQSRVERPYQLILPEAGAYAVDDILNLIARLNIQAISIPPKALLERDMNSGSI